MTAAPDAAAAVGVAHEVDLGPGPDVVAVGAWFKNTVCVVSGGIARVSGSVGDLDDVETCLDHESTLEALLADAGGAPAAVAHDLHPDFHSSRHAVEVAARLGVPALAVQHHHAHIAAVCAEHGATGPVVGLALDGVGLGTDGTAWGGELLIVDGTRFERLGGLRRLPLPGGDRAAREPWRMAAAVLFDLGRGEQIATRFPRQPAAARLESILRSGVRCPPTSSLGRLFDAAAGLLRLNEVMDVEAQAAIALEAAAAAHGPGEVLAGGWTLAGDGSLDLRRLLATLVDEPDASRGAARFHATLGAALADWAGTAAARHGRTRVAIGGGCLFNAILAADLRERLAAAGLTVLLPRALGPGDTAVSLGQAAVARDHLRR